ncbi:MAG: hypothetical protein M1820_009076 [Bogoriella megaspora]|nr:MAG: hypothetical protein M1820_009076 [Bogoriella megaspora]
MASPGNLSPSELKADRGPALMAIYWTECGVALSVVLLRLYSRLILKKMWIDDWMMFLTMLLFVVVCSLTTVSAVNGGAKHQAALSPHQMTIAGRASWLTIPFAILIFATGKISTGLLVLRIMGRGSFWRKWFLHVGMAMTFIFTVIAITSTFAQCSPPRALWEHDIPGAKCWDPRVNTDISIFLAGWNAFFDLCLALLPLTILWNLQVPRMRKTALGFVLSLGVFAAISSITKATKLVELNARSDLTWGTYEGLVWTSAEIFVIIVLGSVPTLKPILDRFIVGSKLGGYVHSSKGLAYPNKTNFHGRSAGDSMGNTSHVLRANGPYQPRGDPCRDAWDEVKLRGIAVKQTFEVASVKNERRSSKSSSEEEHGGRSEEVISGRNIV